MDDNKHQKAPKVKGEENKKEITNEAEEVLNDNNELEQLKSKSEDFKNKYYRALADYQNLERRTREERIEMIKIAQARVIEDFLPFLDTLHQAEVFVKDPGLKMVKDSFLQRLTEMGVKEVELLNKEFDPHTAEAIDTVEGENENIVMEVLRKAYEFHGKILRIGQVKVSRKKSLKV